MDENLKIIAVIVMSFLGGVLLILGVGLATNSIKYDSLKAIASGESYYENTINCNNSDIRITSYCLRDEFIKFFKYNESNMKEDNLKIIKEQGGVCWHSAKWYKDNMESYGYKTQNIFLMPEEGAGHEFTIAYDEKLNYCVMDEWKVECTNLS